MCEIAPQGVSKWTGVRQLADQWGIRSEEICAAGDDVNDIPMIEGAGLGVAMGNALDEVKAAADRIAPGHDEDGLVQVVDWLLELIRRHVAHACPGLNRWARCDTVNLVGNDGCDAPGLCESLVARVRDENLPMLPSVGNAAGNGLGGGAFRGARTVGRSRPGSNSAIRRAANVPGRQVRRSRGGVSSACGGRQPTGRGGTGPLPAGGGAGESRRRTRCALPSPSFPRPHCRPPS